MTRVSFSFFSFIFVILIFSSASAYGQLQDVSDRRVQVYAAGSPALPYGTSDFSNQYQTGYSLTGGLGITLTPDWELSFRGTYSHFNLDQDGYRSSIGGSPTSIFEGEVAVYSVDMSLKHLISTEGRWVPYFAAGIGVYHRDEDDVEVIINDEPYTSGTRTNRTMAGAHVGGGVAYRIATFMSLYLEPRYTSTVSMDSTIDDTLDYAEVRIGLIVSPF